MKHIVDTQTRTWYHMDEHYNLSTCDCNQDAHLRVSIELSQCKCLRDEGELRKLKSEIAAKRRELGVLMSLTKEDLELIHIIKTATK